MVKKILKNKFFILFISFIIIVITARFSPVYSLNDRLITLAIGIEQIDDNYVVTLEAIKPNKDKNDYITVSGKGLSVSSAISNIEKTSNKKVSLNQCEILYLQRSLVIRQNIMFLRSERLKSIPEIAVNVVTDKPSEIIGSKIGESKLNSFMLGSMLRKTKDNFQILEVNTKDLGKNYMSFLGQVTMPYIIINDSQTVTANNNEQEKIINISANQGVTFNKNGGSILSNEDYLCYLILHQKNNKKKGSIEINLDSNSRCIIDVNRLNITKQDKVNKGRLMTKYEVNIKFYDNESLIMLNNDNNNIIKLADKQLDAVKNKLDYMLLNFTKLIKEQKVDLLHLFDDYYAKGCVSLSSKDFLDKLDISFNVNLIKESKK